MADSIRKIPGPSSFSFLLKLKQPYPAYFHDLMIRYGDIVRCGSHFIMINHPDLARLLLNHDLDYYAKQDIISGRLKKVFGQGILSSNGSRWVEQRKFLNPYFRVSGLGSILPHALQSIDQFLCGWKDRIQAGKPLDLVDEFNRLSVIMTANVFFRADVTAVADEICRIMDLGGETVVRSLPVELPGWLPTPDNLRIRYLNRELDSILAKCIPAELSRDPNGSLGSGLLQTYHGPENGTLLMDEIRTLLVAGSTTIAAAMSNTWQLLGQHTNYLKLLEDEVQGSSAILDETTDIPGHYPFVMKLIQESLRLSPAAHAFWRKCIREDYIGGYHIPKGSSVMVSIYNIHRNPSVWPEPDKFLPSRFDREQNLQRPKHYFMPFGWGPRKCLGDHFSMWVMPAVLIRLLEKFRISILPGQSDQLKKVPALLPEKLEALISNRIIERIDEERVNTY